jgi:signal peptidase II
VRKNFWVVGVLVLVILLADQFIKIYIKTHFMPTESVPVFGDWFVLEYVENQGMAFGTTFGNQMWHKLALSIFRIIAIAGIGYYWFKQAQAGARREFLIAVGLIFAGATGNLIDSMCYDFIFPFDPCIGFNQLEGSGVKATCFESFIVERRHTGFLMGNVVDMFKFQGHWPKGMPWLGGGEVFPAIWNLADASITIGVVMVFLRQRTYFPSKKQHRKPGFFTRLFKKNTDPSVN